jgi:hypothetical protein
VADHGDAGGVDPVRALQERERGEHVVELLGGQQDELQMLARLSTLRSFLAGQDVPHEGRLVGRKALAAPKRISPHPVACAADCPPPHRGIVPQAVRPRKSGQANRAPVARWTGAGNRHVPCFRLRA